MIVTFSRLLLWNHAQHSRIAHTESSRHGFLGELAPLTQGCVCVPCTRIESMCRGAPSGATAVPDYYKVLGVPRDAAAPAIKAAYLRRALHCHRERECES